MTEPEYQALCAACDRLLLAPNAGLERIGIPWLHVIRPHPIFLPRYTNLDSGHKNIQAAARLGRSVASAVRDLGRAMLSGGRFWSGELPQHSDVLIVSHLVNESFIGQESDFYYDRVATELLARGNSVTIALINYTKVAERRLAAAWLKAKVPRVILSPALDFAAELSICRRAITEAKSLWSEANQAEAGLDRSVSLRAAQEALDRGTIAALRLGEQIRALVSQLKPRALVVTYEGHSWERVAFSAARKAMPGIICIGYQHAALFHMQHAAQRGLQAEYNPDVILTSGRVARDRLEKMFGSAGIRVEVMGSNRSFRRDKNRNWLSFSEGKPTCIVLPEGVESECNLLFGFSLKCAEAMPDVEFIWRLHPSMSHESLGRRNPEFRHLPSNVSLSTRPLNEDIARSHWALYRGSTAIVQAVVAGARPVYLSVPGEISVDTLYEIRSCRPEVNIVSELLDLISATNNHAANDRGASDDVLDFCERIFTPLDVSSLAECLENDRRGDGGEA